MRILCGKSRLFLLFMFAVACIVAIAMMWDDVRGFLRFVHHQKELGWAHQVSRFVIGNGRMPFDGIELGLWEGSDVRTFHVPNELSFRVESFGNMNSNAILVYWRDGKSLKPLDFMSRQIRRLIDKRYAYSAQLLSDKQMNVYAHLGDRIFLNGASRSLRRDMVAVLDDLVVSTSPPPDYEDRLLRLCVDADLSSEVRFAAFRNLGIVYERNLRRNSTMEKVTKDKGFMILWREVHDPSSQFSGIALYGMARVLWRHVPEERDNVVTFLLNCANVQKEDETERGLAAIYLLGEFEVPGLKDHLLRLLDVTDNRSIRAAIQAVLRKDHAEV